jgi:hypothetical protein
MVQIPWPHTNAPGDEAQEGAGKLTNVFFERRGDEQSIVWRRAPGTAVFVVDPSAGTANGTSVALGVSSVVNAVGAAAGVAAASGVGAELNLLPGVGQAQGTATASAEQSVVVSVAGSADGTSTATGRSS